MSHRKSERKKYAPPYGTAPKNKFRERRLSGKETVAWIFFGFAFFAFMIPVGLQLPGWIEFEIVLGVWWFIWFAVITGMLYEGQRISDDYRFGSLLPKGHSGEDPPRHAEPPTSPPPPPPPSRRKQSSSWTIEPFRPSADAEKAIAGLILFAFLGGIWIFLEFALPALLFILYLAARGMLARVANVRHRCRGRIGASILRGVLWATVYTAPLALMVVFLGRSPSL